MTVEVAVKPSNAATDPNRPQLTHQDVMSRIAHDQKALLRHISIYAELSGMADTARSDVSENMDRIAQKVQALSKLTAQNRLLASISSDRSAHRVLSLDRLLNEVIARLAKTTEAVPAEVIGAGRIRGDATLLRHAFAELLSKLASLGEPGSRVTFALSADDKVRVTARVSSRFRAEARLFEPFQHFDAADKSRGHSGLAFYIVKRVLDVHSAHLAPAAEETSAFAVELSFPAFEQS